MLIVRDCQSQFESTIASSCELTVLGVLEQDGRSGANLSDKLVVIALHIDMFVDKLTIDISVFGSIVEAICARKSSRQSIGL